MNELVPEQERVHKVFENISKDYDKMNTVISFNQHKSWRNDMMEQMNVQENAAVLDVCCGTADWTVALAEEVGPKGQVIGLDFSESMLEAATDKVAPYEQVELVQGDAMNLPFPDNSFDYVTIGFGLRNIRDYRQALREMHRVLKPGGMFASLETSQPESPMFRVAFRLYFKYIMPLCGAILSKHYKEYSWLEQSAKEFPGKKQLAKELRAIGFEDIFFKGYTGSVAAGHIGFKAE